MTVTLNFLLLCSSEILTLQSSFSLQFTITKLTLPIFLNWGISVLNSHLGEPLQETLFRESKGKVQCCLGRLGYLYLFQLIERSMVKKSPVSGMKTWDSKTDYSALHDSFPISRNAAVTGHVCFTEEAITKVFTWCVSVCLHLGELGIFFSSVHKHCRTLPAMPSTVLELAQDKNTFFFFSFQECCVLYSLIKRQEY